MAQDENDFLDPYRLLRRDDGSLWTLGGGRMGTIYKARRADSEEDLALRIIDPQLVGPELAEFLARSMHDVHALSSPFIANIRAVLAVHGKLLVVEELAPGESLARIVGWSGALLSKDVVLSLANDAAQALETAHEAGWVHGGIKPSNLLLQNPAAGRGLKIGGFGVRRILALVPPPGLNFSDLDPVHASPEQIAGQPPDVRSDFFSLGSALWFALGGIAPFKPGRTGAIDHGRAPSPDKLRAANVSASVCEMLLNMLRVDPARRPQSAGELLGMIDACRYASTYGSKTSHGFSAKHAEILLHDEHEHEHDHEMVGHATFHPHPEDRLPDDSVPPPLPLVDENIQFTAYRPKIVRPACWAKLLVFAHLDERPDWMDQDERGPLEEVIVQAKQFLGDKVEEYRATTEDSRLAVPRDGEITLVPTMDGVQFNPPRRAFFWTDGISVHSETFEMRASAQLEGQTARGRLTIFLGALILAEITLSIRVDSRPAAPGGATAKTMAADAAGSGRERSTAKPFRRIFASYSHRDLEIVESVERHARTLGDEYLRDSQQLRSGELWNERLLAMIDEADVFQLFWSSHAATSRFVQQEWNHALALGRATFVRPTYWEMPMPEPPPALQTLHFHRLGAIPAGSENVAHPAAPLPPAAPVFVPPPAPAFLPESDPSPEMAATVFMPPATTPPPQTLPPAPLRSQISRGNSPATTPPPQPLSPVVAPSVSVFPTQFGPVDASPYDPAPFPAKPAASRSKVGRRTVLSSVVGLCVVMLSVLVVQVGIPHRNSPMVSPPAPQVSSLPTETDPGKVFLPPPLTMSTPAPSPRIPAFDPPTRAPTTAPGGDADPRRAAAARIERVPGTNDSMRKNLLATLDRARNVRLASTIVFALRPARGKPGGAESFEPSPGEIERVLKAIRGPGGGASTEPASAIVVLGYADEGNPKRSVMVSQKCADAILKALQKRGGQQFWQAVGMGSGADLPPAGPDAPPAIAPGQHFVEVWAANL